MEQIKHALKKTLLGKYIKCKRCEGQAYISLDQGRYKVNCRSCGDENYLKLYNLNQK